MKKRFKKITDWRSWIRGIFSAVIGGGANALSVMIIKPDDFNFTTGWQSLWQFMLISALIALGLYLKQCPVPPQIEVEATRFPFPINPPK